MSLHRCVTAVRPFGNHLLAAFIAISCVADRLSDASSGPPSPYENAYCVKVRVCGGYANGKCAPRGVVCKPDSCEPAPDGSTPDYCSWYYVFDCYGPALTICVSIVVSEISTDCGMGCHWISYNQCACECQALGSGVESSDYPQCQTMPAPVGP